MSSTFPPTNFKMDELIEEEINYGRAKERFKIAKQMAAEEFRVEKRSWFRLMDFAVLLMILFNVGALVITNALVVQQQPEIELKEGNPVTAERFGYEPTQDTSKLYGFLAHAAILAFLLFMYIWQRNKIYNTQAFNYILAIVCFYVVTLGMDFFNDFGFLIGKVLYG